MSNFDPTGQTYSTGAPDTVTPLPAPVRATASAPVGSATSSASFLVGTTPSQIVNPDPVPRSYTVKNDGCFPVYLSSDQAAKGRDGYLLRPGEQVDWSSGSPCYARTWSSLAKITSYTDGTSPTVNAMNRARISVVGR